MFRPDTRADLTRYEVFVEVDGKPYKITRTIQNWTTYGWDSNQGSSQGGGVQIMEYLVRRFMIIRQL